MFKNKFEGVGNSSQPKATVQKGIRTKLCEQFPAIEPYLESLWPSKTKLTLVKLKGEGHLNLYAIKGEVLFL